MEIKYIVFEKNNAVRDVQRFFDVIRRLDIRHVQYAFHADEVGGGTLGLKTLLGAAVFVRMAREASLTCHAFGLSDNLSRRVEQMSREL